MGRVMVRELTGVRGEAAAAASSESVAEIQERAHKALAELALILPPGDFRRGPVVALARLLAPKPPRSSRL